MSKHTPGPWSVGGGACLGIWSEAAQVYVGTVMTDNLDDPQALADAALIASAPDLYSMLKEAVSGCGDGDEVWLSSDWVKRARELLK